MAHLGNNLCNTLLICRPSLRTVYCKESDPGVTVKVGSIVSLVKISILCSVLLIAAAAVGFSAAQLRQGQFS